MKLRTGPLFALAFASFSSFAQLKDWPEPELAFAHDQDQITAEVLSAEKQELDAYDQWMEIKYKSGELQDDFERTQRLTRRYGILLKGEFVSLDSMAIAQYLETKADNLQKRHTFDLQHARAVLEFQKMRVMAKGNPQADHRLAMTEALLDSKRAKRAALEFDLKTAEFGKKLAEIKVAVSKPLLKKRHISEVTMEDREDMLEDFSRDILNISDHMKNLDSVVTGLERDLDRLKRVLN